MADRPTSVGQSRHSTNEHGCTRQDNLPIHAVWRTLLGLINSFPAQPAAFPALLVS